MASNANLMHWMQSPEGLAVVISLVLAFVGVLAQVFGQDFRTSYRIAKLLVKRRTVTLNEDELRQLYAHDTILKKREETRARDRVWASEIAILRKHASKLYNSEIDRIRQEQVRSRSAWRHFRTGMWRFAGGEYGKAKTELEISLQLEHSWTTMVELARVSNALRLPRLAIALLERAEEDLKSRQVPVDPKIPLCRASALALLQDYEGALACLEMAEQITTDQEPEPILAMYRSMSAVLARLGRLEESLAALQKAEETLARLRLPPDIGILNNRAATLFALGKNEEGESMLNQAMEAQIAQGLGHDPALVTNKVYLLINRGSTDIAWNLLEDFAKARKRRGLPPHPLIFIARGNILLKMNRAADALKFFREAENTQLKQGLPPLTTARLGMALAYLHLEDKAMACRIANEAYISCSEQDQKTRRDLKELLELYCNNP